MEEVLKQVPENVLVLIIVLMLERIVPLTANYNPLSFFKALTLAISAKVHSKKRSHSVGQQKIAGAMAIPTLLLPFLFLAYMMTLVVEFPLVFDGLLLWMCLCWTAIRKDALGIAKALKKEQKSLAKAKLSPWVLRSTAKLSPMGLCKSTIEMVVLRSSKEYFAVMFYFLTLGSFFMLFCRLMMILNQCWNPKAVHFRHFGQLAQWLCYLLEWLPNRLVAFAIMLLNDFNQSFRLMRAARRWGNDNSLHLLAATASGLKVSLGGPVIYENLKIRRPVIGNKQSNDPSLTSVRQAVALVEKVLTVWLLVVILIGAMYYAVVVI
jgi:adenosylcobinamide-phosphate synthase